MSAIKKMAVVVTMAISIFTTGGCASMDEDYEPVDASTSAGREDIRQVIRDRNGDINACYQARLTAVPHLRGKLVLDWMIKRDGTVGPVRVLESVDSAVDTCAANAVKTWKFPPLKDRPFMKIRYPFNLRR